LTQGEHEAGDLYMGSVACTFFFMMLNIGHSVFLQYLRFQLRDVVGQSRKKVVAGISVNTTEAGDSEDSGDQGRGTSSGTETKRDQDRRLSSGASGV